MANFNNQAFKRDLETWVKRQTQSQEQIVRGVALSLLRKIVFRTPVLTGRLRGAWTVQEDLGAGQERGADASGNATIQEGSQKIASFKIGGKLYILNHLPYAIPIEYGHSQVKAPEGMVRITVEEFQQFVREEVAKERK